MLKLMLIVSVVTLSVLSLPEYAFSQDCAYWQARVGVKTVKLPPRNVDEKDLDRIVEGIECLLKLQGDKTQGAFGRATHSQVSEMLPMATVEICALYYVSKLFYQQYDHANGVVLVDEKGKWNTPTSVGKAFKSYRSWFETVKRIGIVETRARKLDPLDGSGIRWY